MERLRRGQVFAISWRTPSEPAEAAGGSEDPFGLFLVDWFLDHNPVYKGPEKRLMAVRGLLFKDEAFGSWPVIEWRIILDVKDITNIERIKRDDFNYLWYLICIFPKVNGLLQNSVQYMQFLYCLC